MLLMKSTKARLGNQNARKVRPADAVINLRVTRWVKEEWKAKAKAAGLSLSAWIDRACRRVR
jgi:predicted HicB family RNase H-like nuclease